MKSRLAVLGLLAVLCGALVPATGTAAGAQSLTVAPPPAYAVGTRLAAQADAARAFAGVLAAAGDSANATVQREIARRRAYQAIRKYGEVTASRTYGHTPFAAEALYHTALLQAQYYGGKAQAVQTLKTLRNTFGGADFPDKAAADAAYGRFQVETDTYNRTHYPQSVLYGVMNFLVNICGGPRFSYSYALAILLISVIVKLALTPLSNKQYASMREMQRLQPYMKEIQAKYKNDKETQGRKMMELYKEHGVNPAAGCLPLLPTIPIMYGLWYTISLYQYQFAHGSFLWIGTGLSRLFPNMFAPDLSQQDVPLLLLYAGSMYVTQKMTITPSLDPQQAEQQRMTAILMPFMMTFMFLQYHLPSAFILYYLIFNVLSTVQQKYYMKKHALDGPPPGDGGDGGLKTLRALPPTGDDGGRAKALPANGNGNGAKGRPALPGRSIPVAEAKGDAPGVGGDKFARPNASNGATPTARGVIAPKVHPKKKRR